MKVKIAIAQGRGFRKSDGEAFAKEALSMIDDAGKRGAKLVLLPQGYPGGFLRGVPAEECFERAREQARQYNMIVVYGSLRPVGDDTFNIIASVIDTKGQVVYEYARCFPREAFFYPTFAINYVGGEHPPSVVEVDGLRIGIIQCGEIAVPEAARLCGIDHPDIILHPSCTVAPDRDSAFKTLVLTRAYENLTYVATSQQLLRKGGGVGIITGPKGPVVVAEDSGVTCGEIDIGLVRMLHNDMDATKAATTRDTFIGGLHYRRPELCGRLATV